MNADHSVSAALAFMVPKIPLMLKTAFFHSLQVSSTASKWDLRTEVIVSILRSEMLKSSPHSVSEQQRELNVDYGVRGPMWISKVTVPAPGENDVQQMLLKAIGDMKEGGEQYEAPEVHAVEAEWQGYRKDAAKDEPEPAISEQEKYENLMKEVSSDAVVLYFHGGALYLMDPAIHRPTTVRYARLLSGRVFSVRYRLAPQNAFPAAPLDALVAYLSLLYPPPGSFHEPVPADKVIFGGDSAGGNLALVLLQTLLQLHRSSPGGVPKVKFHGHEVEVPLPGGVALLSPWTDLTRSMPSLQDNTYDYLPPPSMSAKVDFPPCENWPTNPPRADLYCEGSALRHPLVSPLAAKDWTGAPPVFFMIGEEMMSDESRLVAQRMARQGVNVWFHQYQAMPHCFAIILEENPSAKLYFEHWKEFVNKALNKPETMHASAYFISAKTLVTKKLDAQKLTDITDERAMELMKESQRRLCKDVDAKTPAAL